MTIKQPIFKSVFGASWDLLPIVMKKHYSNTPYSSDVSTVEGEMDIYCATPLRFLAPMLRLLKGIPPVSAKNVPVSVSFESDPHSRSFTLNRSFNFVSFKPYRFKSSLYPIKGNTIVEIMRYGIGWKADVVWEDNLVKLNHRGYVIKVFGCLIPIPMTILLGAGNAIEKALDDNSFEMKMDITHPMWGLVYEYKGVFRFKDSDDK